MHLDKWRVIAEQALEQSAKWEGDASRVIKDGVTMKFGGGGVQFEK